MKDHEAADDKLFKEKLREKRIKQKKRQRDEMGIPEKNTNDYGDEDGPLMAVLGGSDDEDDS